MRQMAVEQGWGRFRDLVVLSPEEGSALIGEGVVELQPFAGGRRNSNYRVAIAHRSEPCVLRLYTADPTACVREQRLLELVNDQVPVPQVLRIAPSASPPWSLMTFVEGERMDLALASASSEATWEMTRAAGQALARIHHIKFPAAGFLDEQLQVSQVLGPEFSWQTFLRMMLDHNTLRDNLGADVADELRRFIDRNVALQQQMSFGGPCLSHSDYKPWNLLASGSHVVAVLDWEFAFAGAPLNDIGNFLRYSARQRPEYESGFIEGYREAGGALPDDWRRLARLVDLMNLLDFMSRRDSSGAITRDVRPLLEATLREYA